MGKLIRSKPVRNKHPVATLIHPYKTDKTLFTSSNAVISRRDALGAATAESNSLQAQQGYSRDGHQLPYRDSGFFKASHWLQTLNSVPTHTAIEPRDPTLCHFRSDLWKSY